MMYRQGDLLIKKIKKLPSGIVKKKDNVVLRGEATGHAHALQHGTVYEMFGYAQRLRITYLEVPKLGKLVHEEHNPIELPQGIYEVVRQREFPNLTVND